MAGTQVGLEITEESVRAVEVTRGRTPTLVAFGEVPLPRDAARDSEVLDQDAVAVALRQLWSAAGINSKRVTLGVGSRRILVREYTTQAMAPELLRQALPYQVQDLLPVPVSQAVLDFYPIAQTGDQVTGLLVAAVTENIENLIATLAKAKLHVDAVDLTSFGLARVARGIAPEGQRVAMIHLGDHTTHVVIATDGVPNFVRILPIDLPTDAARREEILAVAAPALELEEMFAHSPASTRSRAALRTATTGDPVVADLVGRLRSTLSFFSGRPGASPVATVFVSGAGYAAPTVAEAIERGFDVPVLPLRVTDVIGARAVPPDGVALNLVGTVGIVLGEGPR